MNGTFAQMGSNSPYQCSNDLKGPEIYQKKRRKNRNLFGPITNNISIFRTKNSPDTRPKHRMPVQTAAQVLALNGCLGTTTLTALLHASIPSRAMPRTRLGSIILLLTGGA